MGAPTFSGTTFFRMDCDYFRKDFFQNFSEYFPNWWHVCMRCRKYTCQCRMYTWDISWHQPTICQHILSIWRLQGMLHSSTCSKIFTKNHAVGKNTYLKLLMSSSWWMGSPPCQQIRGSQLSCRGWWCQGQHTWWRGWENVLLGDTQALNYSLVMNGVFLGDNDDGDHVPEHGVEQCG